MNELVFVWEQYELAYLLFQPVAAQKVIDWKVADSVVICFDRHVHAEHMRKEEIYWQADDSSIGDWQVGPIPLCVHNNYCN